MATSHRVRQCTSASAWRTYLQQTVDARASAVVFFTASWCAPCRRMNHVYADASRQFSHIFFFKMDIDQVPDVANEWNIEAYPTFLFIRNGNEVDRVVGARRLEFMSALMHLLRILPSPSPPASPAHPHPHPHPPPTSASAAAHSNSAPPTTSSSSSLSPSSPLLASSLSGEEAQSCSPGHTTFLYKSSETEGQPSLQLSQVFAYADDAAEVSLSQWPCYASSPPPAQDVSSWNFDHASSHSA